MNIRKLAVVALCAAIILSLVGCDPNAAANNPRLAAEPTVDPHEGMVEVSDGNGGTRWVEEYENVALNDFDETVFYAENGRMRYSGSDYTASHGIDVSFYQGDIDWNAVAADGVEFAIIRVGYRGYSEGGLFEDERFWEYIQGASEAGLRLGVYFFSQAITAEEAREEARFVLERIGDYDITLPVVYDWESAGVGEEARTYGLDRDTLTDCAAAFCETISEAGYTPAVYFYRSLGYEYRLDALGDYMLWFSSVESWPTFYYKIGMWQYSFTGTVAGIGTDVDMNLYFEKIPETTTAAETATE